MFEKALPCGQELTFYSLPLMDTCIVLFTNRTSSWLFQHSYKAESRRGPLNPRTVNAWLRHHQFLVCARTDITNQSQHCLLLIQNEAIHPRQWYSIRLRAGSFDCLFSGEATALPFVATSWCPPNLSSRSCTIVLAEHPVAQVETTFPSLPCSLL